MDYYELVDSFEIPDRWYLGTPLLPDGSEFDPRVFTEGKWYSKRDKLCFPVTAGHQPIDFTLGPFEVPVVTCEVASRLNSIVGTEIQRIPVTVERSPHQYMILNVLPKLDCLAEDLSGVSYWTAEDGLPEKIGQYFGVAKIVIFRERMGGTRIFRIKGWELPIIVAETVKKDFEEAGVTGIAFERIEIID